MTAIQTTVHVGPDGMLRLEVPVEQRNRDVAVTVLVDEAMAGQGAAAQRGHDSWSSSRQQLEAAGVRVPAPGVSNPGPVTPIDLPGPSASEILIRDRR